jgi:menaquinone-dependent protoporphyrinogen IX oxidase
MRAAVVFFGGSSRDKILGLARALARGMEAQGHQVDIVDGDHDINAKMTMYQYVAVGTEPLSGWSGKISERIGQFLSSAGMVAGKRSFAFVAKNMVGCSKALSRLMKSMETEGMLLKFSSVLSSAQEAEEIGKRLHLEK